MNRQTNPHAKMTEPANPLMNAAILAAVALAILPAAIFGAVRFSQTPSTPSTKAVEVEETTPKRSSVAERRAQRLEARKAKEANAQNIYPEITMEKVDSYYDDFGLDYDADMGFNGGGMMPPVYMGGPGMMPPAYMGGPGMMPAPGQGSFNEFRRMSGAEMGFNNRFGRGRGGF